MAQWLPLNRLRSCLYVQAYKGLDDRFPKKGLDKKAFVVRDEAPYFSEVLGFSPDHHVYSHIYRQNIVLVNTYSLCDENLKFNVVSMSFTEFGDNANNHSKLVRDATR